MEIIKDKQQAIELLKDDGLLLENVSDELKKNPEVVLTAINKNPLALKYADERFKKNKKVVEFAISKIDNANIRPTNMRSRGDYYYRLMQGENQLLYYVDSSLRDDEEIITKAVKKFAPNLQFANSEMKKNKNLVLDAISYDPNNTGLSVLNARSFFFADPSLIGDEEFVREAVKKNPLIGKDINNFSKLPFDEATVEDIRTDANGYYSDIMYQEHYKDMSKNKKIINSLSNTISNYYDYMDEVMFKSEGDLATERRVAFAFTPLPYVHLVSKGVVFVGSKIKDLSEYSKEKSEYLKARSNKQALKFLKKNREELESLNEPDDYTNTSIKKR